MSAVTTPTQLFIGGTWRDAEGGQTFDVLSLARPEIETELRLLCASASISAPSVDSRSR